jgi:putative ABC transport system substrate-binding protein
MSRRYLLLACGLVFLNGPLAVDRGRTATVPRIGLLGYLDCGNGGLQLEFGAFLQALEQLGYRRGEGYTIECQGAGKDYDTFPAAAQKLAELPVDVIVTLSQPAGQAAHQVTDTVPIVSIVSGDPVSAGLVASLAEPGGNFTGVSYYATELTAKRLELLKEAVPGIVRIGVLANPDVAYLPFEADTIRAAEKLGIGATIHQVSQPAELDAAIAEIGRQGVQALFVLPDVMLANQAAHICNLALEERLPTMTWAPWYTEAGCLLAYSADYPEMIRRLTFYVDRILKGANPGDLPLEQPTTFRLAINLKTALALNIIVPQTLLMLADDVVE